jgi:hypothetical protein
MPRTQTDFEPSNAREGSKDTMVIATVIWIDRARLDLDLGGQSAV